MRRCAVVLSTLILEVTLAFVTKCVHPLKNHKAILFDSPLNEIAEEEEEDWRSFRARLVQQGLPGEESTSITSLDSNNGKTGQSSSYAYECTPLVEVGTILVSIPTTDLCQALEQQFWHRCVVLITSVSENVAQGEEETTVSDDQLAQGDNRGRWSYRGLLLNRMTNIVDEDWGGNFVMRGGDLASLDTKNTQFTCLHNLESSLHPEVTQLSSRLVGNLSCLSADDVANILHKKKSKCDVTDFVTYGGFCAWRPGQLEREMGSGRGEWLALSVNADFVWKEIHSLQQHPGKSALEQIQAGTNMWKNFLHAIQHRTSMDRIPAGQLAFYDKMLEVWAEDNLLINKKDDDDNDKMEQSTQFADKGPSITSNIPIGPGTLTRAITPVLNDILLYDQGFIRSLVLVLNETKDATVGIILNHPMSAAIECCEGDVPLPIRYGGPIDLQTWKHGEYLDDDDNNLREEEDSDEENELYEGFEDYDPDNEDLEIYDDDDDFLWIHRNKSLGASSGTQLGTSGLWIIKEDDAIDALQTGSLSQNDIMVFSGVCIWEKESESSGGLREQIDTLQSFEIVGGNNNSSDETVIQTVWDILVQKQGVLTKESLEGNWNAIMDAWVAAGQTETNQRQELSDAALRAWLGVNLLLDPLGTLVEL